MFLLRLCVYSLFHDTFQVTKIIWTTLMWTILLEKLEWKNYFLFLLGAFRIQTLQVKLVYILVRITLPVLP
jgi:hypothetical protein